MSLFVDGLNWYWHVHISIVLKVSRSLAACEGALLVVDASQVISPLVDIG